MSEKFEKEILEKLNIIINLLSHGPQVEEGAPQTETILRLRKMGLKPTQIAQTLNTTGNYVNMILSKKRRGIKRNG